jgi:hypothetical protein
MGAIIGDDGLPAANTQVILLPENYNPLFDTMTLPADTTDMYGRYELSLSHHGIFNLQAVQLLKRTRLLMQGIVVINDTDTVTVGNGTLASPGFVKIELPDEVDRENGYLYISGTTIAVPLSNTTRYAVLDSVPAGTIPSISYAPKKSTSAIVLRYNTQVISRDTAIIQYPSWKFSKKLVLNTTKTGANVVENVLNFPVLVRLNKSNFTFNQAQKNGGDIRFAKDNGLPLSYQIELWDSTTEQAAIWVKVDTIFGNDSTHAILMYWGSGTASDSSAGSVVFDTGNGFNAVWHLGDTPSGSASIKDQTAHKYNATPLGDFTNIDLVDGSIGRGLHFNGTTDIVNPGQQIKKGPNFTVEPWVSITQSGNQRFIHDPTGYTLWYDNEIGGIRLEFRDKSNGWRGIPQNGGTAPPITMGKWYHIAGTSDGKKLRVYVNGTLATTSDTITAIPNPLTATDSLRIGGASYGEHAKGIMDEVRIQTVVRSDEWIKLSYMNQKERDLLLKW